jgi:ADP-heptose:LPS heptosyltransferase
LDRLFTHRAEPPGEAEHMLDRYARLARELGLEYEPVTELRLRAEDERAAETLMKRIDPQPAPGLRVAMHPGNFKKFENRWPEDKFAALSDKLLGIPSLRLFYLAGPGEETPARAILSRLKSPVPLIPPSPLGLTGALMRRMDLCVLNITGTTHLAAALGVPTFGFYSGYTHAVWRPRGVRHSGVASSSWESCRDISVEAAWTSLRAALGIC